MSPSPKQPLDLTIRPFQPPDQEAARDLILGGLRGRFASLYDEGLNPDLHDIAASYAQALFVVAIIDQELVGTGALINQGTGLGQVVRMSVDRRHRRKGIGRAILDHLLESARSRGYLRVVLATNASWDDAIAFYKAGGFTETLRAQGRVLFSLDLTADRRP